MRKKACREASSHLLFSLLICTMLVFMLACQSAAPPKAAEIVSGDTCALCKQPIADKRFAAQFITRDGFVRKFDDIACMVEHAKNKMKTNNVAAYFTVDLPTGQWIKADEGTYVRAMNFQTPKGGGIIAYRDKAKANDIAAKYQAQLVAFAEIIK